MGSAGFTSILNRTCSIQKRTMTGVDSGGKPIGVFGEVQADVPCRIEMNMKPLERLKQGKHEDGIIQIIRVFNLMLETTAQVTDNEDCRIILDDDRVFDVSIVARGDDLTSAHHLEAELVEVKS